MQSNGVQFYLGIFESEEEAAFAYEKKVIESSAAPKLVSHNNNYVLFKLILSFCSKKVLLQFEKLKVIQ